LWGRGDAANFHGYLREAFEEGNLRFHGEIAGLAEPVAFGAL
jgi:hypothetical protein